MTKVVGFLSVFFVKRELNVVSPVMQKRYVSGEKNAVRTKGEIGRIIGIYAHRIFSEEPKRECVSGGQNLLKMGVNAGWSVSRFFL